MKKCFLVAATVAVTASMAFAESKDLGIGLRLGFFTPSKSETRDITSDTWFSGGVDYRLMNLQSSNSPFAYSLGLSFDWLQRDLSGFDGEVRALPILLTLTGESKDGFFFTTGLGVAFNRISVLVTDPLVRGVPATTIETRNQTRLAYTLGLGYQFKGTTPVNLQVRYQGNGENDLNGLGFYVGFKF